MLFEFLYAYQKLTFILCILFSIFFSFIEQISTLAHQRSERGQLSSERTLRAIGRVGQAVNLAVERFVTVGEAIADDNPEIKQDLYDACKEARAAGTFAIVDILFFFLCFLHFSYKFWQT